MSSSGRRGSGSARQRQQPGQLNHASMNALSPRLRQTDYYDDDAGEGMPV